MYGTYYFCNVPFLMIKKKKAERFQFLLTAPDIGLPIGLHSQKDYAISNKRALYTSNVELNIVENEKNCKQTLNNIC